MKKIQILFAALILTSNLLYSQGFEEITDVSPMNVTRYGHASVSLPDGKVLVIGGHTQGFQITSTAEIYDSQTNEWTLYNIDNPHDGCSYVKLSNGNFMFFGGFSGSSGIGQSTVTTIFNPETSVFTSGPQMNVARGYSTAVKLTDDRVMIVGNWYNTGDAEIFDPSTNTFTSIGIPLAERSNPLVFPSNDGGAVILGGNGNYGSPAYSDIVHYDPESMEFLSLSPQLIEGETGWTTSWSASFDQLSEMKLSTGNYIFMIYRALDGGNYEYAFAEFNPETKEVTKMNSTPELPLYNGTNPNEWGFGLSISKHPSTDYAYIMAVGSSSAPFLTRLYAFDPATGNLDIPDGQAAYNYYLHSSSKSWVNGNLLCTGGSINGSNFDITNEAKLLSPQNSLSVNWITNKSTGIQVYPNPVSNNTFQINSMHHSISIIDIIDVRGIVVKSTDVNANDQIHYIERGNLSNGVYVIRMRGLNSVFTEKVIFN